MGDMLRCPLCCSEYFSSKQTLAEHLTNILTNLNCPICKTNSPSLIHLIQHLNTEDCQSSNTIHTLAFDENTRIENGDLIEQSPHTKHEESDTDVSKKAEETQNQFSSEEDVSVTPEDSTGNGKMFVELLSKQLMKPCLQTQELKLVKEHGESRYVILTQEEPDLKTGNTVVTKQNSDGTISLTTVKDVVIPEMKVECNQVPPQSNTEVEQSQDEIYSCNACGVLFSSVIEHIQNYHNDQDVVVEEPLEDSTDATSLEYNSIANEVFTTDKQAPRRMITDTGDIVEAPFVIKANILKPETIVSNNTSNNNIQSIREEVVDKRGRVYTRRYVQIDKFCESVVKNIKKDSDSNGPYHKVVVKEMETLEGRHKIKVYNCVSCNIYVTTLEEFKLHPCKPLKYQCPHCPVSYDNSKSLCAHMKVHKSIPDGEVEVAGPFKCDICFTIFPTNKSLKLHRRMHDPIKSRPIDPPVENSEGTEPTNDRYLCTVCCKMIPIGYRAVHQNSHKTSNKYICEICNRKFSSSGYLEMHMNVHNVDKAPVKKSDISLPYTCLYCNRQFARPHEKVKHERIHTGEKPHACEICGKSFRVSYCLTLHMRTHTGARPYACAHCGKRFKAHSVYNHHLLTHSEVRAYKCPFCPKAFKTAVQLAGHKNSHTKPFSCQQCNRPFASLYAVRVHTETHARQNNLKFSCSLCGASYARTFALKDHIKQVHKQDLDSADTLEGLKEESWVLSENVEGDAEGMPTLSKDVTAEINELGINANEPESVMVTP